MKRGCSLDKRKKQIVIILGLILSSVIIFTHLGLAIGVRPLGLEFEMKPGEERDFELTFTPADYSEVVDFSLYQPNQNRDGSLSYLPASEGGFPAANWIRLESDQVVVAPGMQTILKGKVRVPLGAQGSHTVILMIEPKSPTQQQGVIFRVRYAVRLIIRVDRVGLRKTAELVEGWGIIPGEEQQPILQVDVKNTSAWDYLVSGDATIRDANRKLVERIQLRSLASITANVDETRVYPGSQVQFIGEITRRLTPGEYTVQTFIKYGDFGQIIRSQKIQVAEGDYQFPHADQLGAFSVEEEAIELVLQPGQRKTIAFGVTSELTEDTVLVVRSKEIAAKYEFSNQEWFELRSNQLDLRSRQSKKLVLTCVVPREVTSGSYHSELELLALTQDGEKVLGVKQVPVTVIVGGDEYQEDAQVKSLQVTPGEEGEDLITLDLGNSGEIRLQVEVTMLLKQEGQIVETVQLTLPEGVDHILPAKSQILTGSVSSLADGTYQAEILVYTEGKELKQVTREIIIEK